MGRLSAVESSSQTVRYEYDEIGRVSREHSDLGGYRFSVERHYNDSSQLTDTVYPKTSLGQPALSVQIKRDGNGYPYEVLETQSGISIVREIQIDEFGGIRNAVYANGVEERRSRDQRTGFLTGLQLRRGATALSRNRYQYDPGGRLTDIADILVPERSYQYDLYDGLDRIRRATGPFGPGNVTATREFDYSPYGNLRMPSEARQYGRDVSGLPPDWGAVPHAATSVGGEILSYSGAGRLTSKGTRSFEWDGFGRLAAVRDSGQLVADFEYSPLGRKSIVSTPNSTRFIASPEFEWSNGVGTAHIYLGGQRVATVSKPFLPEASPAVVPLAGFGQIRGPSPWRLAEVVSALPPLLILGFLLVVAPTRRAVRVRRVVAGTTIAVFWVAICPPPANAEGDVDADGLSNSEEARRGTSSTSADSDGDGVSDGVEVALNSDPLDRFSVPAVYGMIGAVEMEPIATQLADRPAGVDAIAQLHIVGSPGGAVAQFGSGLARFAAHADVDGDGVIAMGDADDASALVGGRSRFGDLDGDGILNEFDGDMDGDGLLNSLDDDADGDGLLDSLENSLYGTDLFSTDTDADGLSDRDEIQAGTNPLLADSDGDGLLDGTDPSPLDARPLLRATSDSDVNHDGLFDVGDVAIVLMAIAEPGSLDAETEAQADVAPKGAPDGALDAGDTFVVLSAFSAGDSDGDGISNADERAAGTNPFSADTDGDSISDWDELNPPEGVPATDPTLADTDDDGLSDAVEIAGLLAGLGTDPTHADSDGDGVSDSEDLRPGEVWSFHHYDHIGNAFLVTSFEGEVIRHAAFAPYGESVAYVEGIADYRFNGMRRHEDTGLHDFGFRHYDESIRTFISPDPIVPSHYSAELRNAFAYAAGDPVNKRDLLGLAPAGGGDPFQGVDEFPVIGDPTSFIGFEPFELGSFDLADLGGLDTEFGVVTDFGFSAPFNLMNGNPAALADIAVSQRLGGAHGAHHGAAAGGTSGQTGTSDTSPQISGDIQMAAIPGAPFLYALAVRIATSPAGVRVITAMGFGGMFVAGPNGVAFRSTLERAASAPGPTIRVVTNLTQAPQLGRALSTAIGSNAQALAQAARANGQIYSANIPQALVSELRAIGLAEQSITNMGTVVGTELRFLPAASQYIVPLFQQGLP